MEETIIFEGRRVPKDYVNKYFTMWAIRGFAYDTQLNLFPDKQIEEARNQLREKFESGEPIEIKRIRVI